MEEILRMFSEGIQTQLNGQIRKRWPSLQEIRIRLGQPVELIFNDNVEWINSVKPTRKDMMYIINQLSEFSLYRMEEELREGYITIEGGHRVGLAGKVNTRHGTVKALQYITFMNIRIAKEKIGAAEFIMPYLHDNQQYMNTLFIGAPLMGKTTLIRDVTRIMSSGWRGVEAKKIGVVDERSEIGASLKGGPQHELGRRTDVLDACPKAEGMMMLIRSMSPEVIIVDEIGSEEDVQALLEAINAGVTVICTIHGQSLDELKKRPSVQPLFYHKVFKRMILLENEGSPGRIKAVYNEFGQIIS